MIEPKCKRWNFDADAQGLLVCRGDHATDEPCQWERLEPYEALGILQQIRAESIALHAIVDRFLVEASGRSDLRASFVAEQKADPHPPG